MKLFTTIPGIAIIGLMAIIIVLLWIQVDTTKENAEYLQKMDSLKIRNAAAEAHILILFKENQRCRAKCAN